MGFATDRMLMVLEPNLFREVQFAGQVMLSVADGSTVGTTLSTVSGNFVAAQIGVGQVALVDDVPVEVLEVVSQFLMTVSRLRPDIDGDAIAPIAGFGQQVVVTTFGAQLEIVHGQLLRAFGIEVMSTTGAVQAADVVNVREVALVEALGALYQVYTGASALVGNEATGLERKAALYRERYLAGRERLVVQLDLDGDGLADASRVSNVLRLVRD